MRDEEAIARGPTELKVTDIGDEVADGDADSLAPGTFAGDYKVTRHLGAGAMGDVYAGVHPVIGKEVAIKVIKRRLASSGEAAERFVREARAVNQVRHPNVADVFSFGRLDDGRLFLVMDLLEGESLGARIRRDGPLEHAAFLDIITQVCEALAAAHAKNVIHRDLKPDNVFLAKTEDGRERVYVLDFGIAKILSDVATETARGTLTGEGVWMGTPAYMAPEQWTAEGASRQSDIYALGTMAFEMLSGSVPYAANSVPAIMEKHFHADVPPLTTAGGIVVAQGIADAIAHAMAKKPEDRFDTALEFLDAVREGATGTTTRRSSRRRVVAATTLEDRDAASSRAGMWAAIGAIGVLATGMIVLFLAKGGTSDKPTDRADDPQPNTAELRIPIITRPKGARIVRDGKELGRSPHSVAAKANELIRVRLSKPGYAPIVREVSASEGARMDVTLPAVTGFKGLWRLPKGALRGFERRGDRVAGFKLTSVQGKGTFLRFFEFLPSEGDSVTFGAREDHIDEKAPNEPSCRIPLRAEYRFHPARDRLELRRERVQYNLVNGRCVVERKAWGPYEKVARVVGSESSATWASSSAGAGPIRVDAQAKGTKNKAVRRKNAKPTPKRLRKTVKAPPRQTTGNRNAKRKLPVTKSPKNANLGDKNADNRVEANNIQSKSAQRKDVQQAVKPRPINANPPASSEPPRLRQGSAAQRGTPPRPRKKN